MAGDEIITYLFWVGELCFAIMRRNYYRKLYSIKFLEEVMNVK